MRCCTAPVAYSYYIENARSYLKLPHGRTAGFAGWDARREECTVVVPLERRATKQTARKTAARAGFAPFTRLTSLHTLRMRFGHSTRRAPRRRAKGPEMRLMGEFEIGSGLINPLRQIARTD